MTTTVERRGRTVLAMDCALAGAEFQHGRRLNSVVRRHMGVAIGIAGIVLMALGVTLLSGPWKGGSIVLGAILVAIGIGVQRRKSLDWSDPDAHGSAQNKDYLPGKIGGDPRDTLAKAGSVGDSAGGGDTDGD